MAELPEDDADWRKLKPSAPKYGKGIDGVSYVPMTGRVARMHNITWSPMSEDEQIDEGHEEYPEFKAHPYRLYSDEPLNTTQNHFSAKGVRYYFDKNTNIDRNGEKPRIFADDDGELWIHDGHHRIIASRLKGEPYIDVMRHENWGDDGRMTKYPEWADYPEEEKNKPLYTEEGEQ